MKKSIRGKLLLGCACLLAGASAWGQRDQNQAKPDHDFVDVAVVYNPLMANVVGVNSFWMQGGSAQVHGQFWHGLGAVADVAGLHAGDINSNGVGLDLVTATFGPRYTWSHRRYAVFGQALAGEAFGLNSIFPSSTGTSDSANSMALYVGGGVNMHLTRHVSARAFEADWLRTQLPNATTNVQNNLRLGAGLIYRFK